VKWGLGVYNSSMDKRYNNQRPLCIGDDNTCSNLAGLKERKKNGDWRYHTRCDRHRRNGHEASQFRNPNSKRYIPLDKCVLCNEQATDRHRIKRGTEYLPENVLCLCKECHKKVHLLDDLL